jgi:hypothetical protein
MQSEQIDKLTEALAKAQASMGNATLNKVNPHFRSKYADLAAIFDAVRKPLASQGITLTQTTEIRPNAFVLVTQISHAGQWMRSEYPLPVNAKPQELGSALTYARRYSLSAITGIAADEDDDANAAQGANLRMAAKGGEVITDERLLINDKQLEELNELIVEVGTTPEKFCKYLRIATLDELPSSRFSEAKAALESKRKAA